MRDHLKSLTACCALLLASLPAAADDATAANPRSDLLITAEELAMRQDLPITAILDVRPRRDYDAGHLPQAVWVDVNGWKAASLAEDGLTNRELWAQRVSELGVTRETPVVVYGGSPTNATRVWWTLKYLGVDRVSILDGGFDAWVDAGGHITQKAHIPEKSEFEPEFQPDRLATADEVRTNLSEQTLTIIDTRSVAEFEGTGGPGERKGHIPGALHQEWSNFVTEDGRFKPADEIRRLLKEQGLTPETKAVTHCQSGGRASLNAFVMELAGYGPVKNYYCGWREWSTLDGAPVE